MTDKTLEEKVESIIMDSIDWKEGEFKDDPGKQIIQLVTQATREEDLREMLLITKGHLNKEVQEYYRTKIGGTDEQGRD